jgi:two-component system response regulator AtoC
LMTSPRCVLAVHGGPETQKGLATAAARRSLLLTFAANEADALAALEKTSIDVVTVTARGEWTSAIAFVESVTERWPGLPVILFAEGPEKVNASALASGVFDVVALEATADEVGHVLDKALAHSLRARALPPPPSATTTCLFGESGVMRQARELLDRAAASRATVLIRGESGTGKEIAARVVHEQSDRRGRPFVKIDCASLPESLLESELFGYERGAFTGAATRKPGRVELAEGGTLFLDEIGELTESVQAKLLGLLQDREINRLGGTVAIKVDVRVVAATHRDLETMVERREFRQDLFYRLNVVPIWLPPLRARRDDVELLAKHFCEVAARENGRNVRLADDALRFLRRQRWPGNVRQLQNFVERLVVLSTVSPIGAGEASAELFREVTFSTEPASTAGTSLPSAEQGAADDAPVLPLSEEVRLAEKRALERALDHTGGNRSRAARLLGVSRSNLYAKLEEHGLL